MRVFAALPLAAGRSETGVMLTVGGNGDPGSIVSLQLSAAPRSERATSSTAYHQGSTSQPMNARRNT
jgi:hypothetical protein